MRRRLLSVVTLAMLTLPLAAQESDLATAPRITIAELRKLQAANNAIVIDVRDAESFATGHIPGARSIPLATLLDSARVAELKATPKEIVLYCA
jgi:rhodanese-related sulfurtransferase